jgi:hypothetical protein
MKKVFKYENFKNDLEFLEILWISTQIGNSLKSVSEKDTNWVSLTDSVEFVDFNGFSVEFRATGSEANDEIANEEVDVTMSRKKIPEKTTEKSDNASKESSEDEENEVNYLNDSLKGTHVKPSLYGFTLPKDIFVELLCQVLPSYATRTVQKAEQDDSDEEGEEGKEKGDEEEDDGED